MERGKIFSFELESMHMKVAQATCYRRILAYRISVFSTDVDQLSKYGWACVTAYCLCRSIFITDYTFIIQKYFHHRLYIHHMYICVDSL